MRLRTGAVLALAGSLGAAATATGAMREVEVRGARAVVDARAHDRRAVELVPGRSASLRAAPAFVAGLQARARSAGCRAARLTIEAGGRTRHFTVGPRFRHRALKLAAPLASRQIRVTTAMTSSRCRVRLDWLMVRAAASPRTLAPGLPLRSVPLGTAVSLPWLSEPAYTSTLLSAFRSITPENELKMDRTQPRQGEFHFEHGDALVAFAAAHGRTVRGHTLIYGVQTPAWVGQLLFATQVENVLRTHVATEIRHFKSRIREWDVVNEALDSRGRLSRNPFADRLGPRYVDMAYETARGADPTAKLYYNEFAAELPGTKQDAMFTLVSRLKQRGLIDGVGFQLHTGIGTAPTEEELVATMRRFEALGLEIQITEMDVAAKGNGQQSLAARLAAQAAAYGAAASACRRVLACKRLTVWGVTDRYSWRTPAELPLLFDVEYAPKPALAAVTAALG